MSIEQVIHDYLLDDTAVGAIVNERVFAVRLPQKAPLPAITYRRIAKRRIQSHDGPSLAVPLFSFTCWGTSEKEARQLRSAVASAFDLANEAEFRSMVENEFEQEFAQSRTPQSIVDIRFWIQPEGVMVS